MASRTTRVTSRHDVLALTGLTILLRIPAYLAARHLTFDDGVFGASAVAMRAGGQPFRDVFSSQGPLFLPVVWLADLLGFRTASSPRLASVLAGVVLVVATYLAGRSITDRAGALLAAGLVCTSGSILWVTGPLAADGVALAFATGTMALCLRWRSDIDVGRALVLGLGVGLTISVKALLAPIVIPVAIALLAGRRLAPIAAAGLTAIASHLVLWLPWGVGNVWDQAYAYHLDVAGDRTPGRNLAKLLSTLGDRDSLVVVAAVLAIGAVLVHRQAGRPPRGPRLTSPDVLLFAWLVGILLVLLTEHPMWRPHVSQVIPVVALLAARHRPPVRVLIVAAVLVVPYHLVHVWPLLHPTGFSDASAETIEVLRDLPAGAKAISDDPGIVWRAGRLTTDDLVDTSGLRIETGDITAESIAAAAARPDVCAVVVRSAVRWGSLDDLPDRLADLGYEAVLQDGPRTTYVDPDCAPTSG